MKTISAILTALIAIEHIYILWLEMFVWESKGKKVFKGSLHPDLFKPTKVLAANQGLYNGFLAAGLIWSILIEDAVWSNHVAFFFLSCVAVAGIYGSITASRKIFFVQALPAILTLVFRWISNWRSSLAFIFKLKILPLIKIDTHEINIKNFGACNYFMLCV